MERLIALLPVLGCLAMGVMMWLMMRGQHSSTQHGVDPAIQEEINRLRTEIALLKQESSTTGHDAGEPGAKP